MLGCTGNLENGVRGIGSTEISVQPWLGNKSQSLKTPWPQMPLQTSLKNLYKG